MIMKNTPETVAFYTLGCKVNQYDTDVMRKHMQRVGYEVVPFDEYADIYVINTCSVTHISDRKSRQVISRAHKQNPSAIVVVAGCYSKTHGEEVSNLPGVSIVLGTDDRASIVDKINDYIAYGHPVAANNQSLSDDFDVLSVNMDDRVRTYLKIQDGCNRFCSYCIIPYARGKLHSRSIESVKSELERLHYIGCREVVITGIHLMSYGLDLGNKNALNELLEFCGTQSMIPRIRLGSLEPALITHKLATIVGNSDNICRQFHLSLQSGSDSVLKRMNRRYTKDDFRRAVNEFRTFMPDCAITTDIIAGFPGETEDEHAETLDFVREIGFSRIHVFPYSKRPGTPAANMPNQIPQNIKRRRAGELIDTGNALELAYNSRFIGTVLPVLIEET